MNMISIYNTGYKLLEILEIIHAAGYVYNDLTLDKIILGQNEVINIKRNNWYTN